MSKVLITGVTGQDGSIMAEYLLNNTDMRVVGAVRGMPGCRHDNIEHMEHERFEILSLDLCDQQSIVNAVKSILPDYIINFAAQSFVGESWNRPLLTFTTNTLSVIYFLEAIKEYCPNCRFYSAGSSEEFGNVKYAPQDLKHHREPRSPYGASKCAAGHLVRVYRESYSLYAIHSILFNHEGVRRGKGFVTRKVTSNIARICKELRQGLAVTPLELGNINVVRDWSDAEDFVEAIWLMLQQEKPMDYLLSSNEKHSLREFVDLSCKYAGLEVEWVVDHEDATKTVLMCGEHVIIRINKEFYRPAEIDTVFGDSTESRRVLNWEPKSSFEGLVRKMMEHDIQLHDEL
jgi:GDPmannose 4,6-dehydratase